MTAMNAKRRICTALLVLLTLPAAQGQVAAVPDTAALRRPFGAEDAAAFVAPPRINYPQTWFHLIGGNVSAEGITEDFEAIARTGISGVQLFHGQFGGPWPGVDPQIPALSPGWDALVRHAAREARRLGLRFTMQNCSGWATSGGPWIEPSNAMRHLAWSRTDLSAGEGPVVLPRPVSDGEAWRDYRDIAVLAFPTPLDDTGERLRPVAVKSGDDLPWREVIAGTNREPLRLPPCAAGDSVRLEITFPEAVVVRTVELPSMNSINHPRCYEPGIGLTVEAVAPDGSRRRVLHAEVPASNSQDNTPVSFACADAFPATRYRVALSNRHHMTLGSLKFYTAARKNCWESEAGWTLRNLDRENACPKQNPAAWIDPGRIEDLTDRMRPDGGLAWTPPAGRWTVLRIGHVNTGRRNSPAPPEGTGWECNKLDPAGAEAQFAGYIGRLHDGPLSGGLLGGILLDSWECETQTWTPAMEREFARRNDYALRRWLPAVLGYVVDDPEVSARFLRDWRGTISALFTENFYGTMARLARGNGLSVTYETAAGDVFPADILEYFKYADVPMCEFWQPFTEGYVGSLNFKPVKPTASAARLYGKPRVAAEAFTSFSHTWDEHWTMLKEIANLHLSEGVTHLVYHTYTHNPQRPFLPPGTSFGGPGIGTPFLRGQTWWRHMRAINDYFARCSYMQERGWPVSDVLLVSGRRAERQARPESRFPGGIQVRLLQSRRAAAPAACGERTAADAGGDRIPRAVVARQLPDAARDARKDTRFPARGRDRRRRCPRRVGDAQRRKGGAAAFRPGRADDLGPGAGRRPARRTRTRDLGPAGGEGARRGGDRSRPAGRCAVGAPPDGRGRLVFRLSAARRRILRDAGFPLRGRCRAVGSRDGTSHPPRGEDGGRPDPRGTGTPAVGIVLRRLPPGIRSAVAGVGRGHDR